MADKNSDEPPEAENPKPAAEPDERPEPQVDADDALAEAASDGQSAPSGRSFKHWLKTHKKFSIPLGVLMLVLVLLAIPQSRYPLAGTVYKNNVTVRIVDAATQQPVSGADVSAEAGQTKTVTDGQGNATLHLRAGYVTLYVSKTYYENQQIRVLVPLLKQKSSPALALKATGRQVKIKVTNIFTRQSLADVNIKFTDTEAKTDSDGTALGVVPESTKSADVRLSFEGYNDRQVTVQASDSEIKQNNFKLTPAGKIYFLSKLSGNIDVVKANLDGTGRHKVLAGTGREQETNTVLLASRDWHYLALLSRREGDSPKLYLIDTTTDKLTTIDEGDATFTPIGWDDHYFVYAVDRNKLKYWEPNRQSIKSFNADTKAIIPLDSNAAINKSSKHAYESFDYYYYGSNNFYLINHSLIYAKSWSWTGYKAFQLIAGKSNGIYGIGVNGANFRSLKTFDFDRYLDSFLYNPSVVYYRLSGGGTKYYVYANGSVTESSAIKANYDKYQETYTTNTYLQSPDGSRVFWFEERDGKNSLLLGGANAENAKTIGRSADFTPYGWYTDDYILVTKDSSELYILPKSGLNGKTKAFKITDYHKPSRTFYGYGGGYGGL